MGSLNRDERQTLRRIQAHIRADTLYEQVVVEQIGTVDVYFHPSNPDPFLNCATPHKGVAWVRRDDLVAAFEGLQRLGRVPRLVFQDALFPDAFQQQIKLMGLTLEDERVVMVYRPLYGPMLPDEVPRGRLPQDFDGPITTAIAATQAELSIWLRIFRAGYFNTERLHVDPERVAPLVAEAEQGESIFVLAEYQETPLGAAQVRIKHPSAEIAAVATAPLWHGMGLETALVATSVRAAMDSNCRIVFTVAPPDDVVQLYMQLGFVSLTRVLTFWQAEEYANPFPVSGMRPASSTPSESESESDEPDLVQSLPTDE